MFSLNSKNENKEKEIKFDYSIKNNKSISNSLDKAIPKEMQIMVKDQKGKLIKGVNVPLPKKKPKKKLLFWKIGDMVIHRRTTKNKLSKTFIPIVYDIFDTKEKINKFKKKNNIDNLGNYKL